ncbi:hypothetical protein [Streptomyces katrae]|uniref:hypothetical protein n=1 Tax=Streptomyces katrae TaxID=68223 RepID=UPI0004BE8F51|nr:hypothetical protein [Streptomyces katrae]
MKPTISPRQRAENLLYSIFDAAEDGCHTITAYAGGPSVTIRFHNEGRRTYLGLGVDMADIISTTAAALTGEVCGVVLRSIEGEGKARAWGWHVRGLVATPLTADVLRCAYSRDEWTGETLPPVQGLYYDDAPHINLV